MPKRKQSEKQTMASKLKKRMTDKDVNTNSNMSSNVQIDTKTEPATTSNKALDSTFFDQPCEDLAKSLLGKKLVRLTDSGQRLCGKVVETEAYLGFPDKAAHSFKGMTKKNEPMFMAPGTAYVYHIHSYCCMNISSKGEGAAVLLRALEPTENIESMERLRTIRTPGKSLKKHELCNGPSKLCLSLDITKDQINKEDMTKSKKIWIEDGDTKPDKIVHCKRINIGYAEEWIDKPLRFYILGNSYVSKKDKMAEKDVKC